MDLLVPAFLAGLSALSLPFLFHLVRRTPRHRQVFSSLMFLSPTLPRVTRRSRLDQLLLLALRLAALACVALAFTRPFLRETALLSFADLPGRSVALLIDTSASMRRGDLWAQALRQAETELADLNPQDDVALYTFSDRLERIVNFARNGDISEPVTDKPQLVRTRIKALQPAWGASNLGTALSTVAGEIDATADARSAVRTPQIIVISDFQKGSRIEALQSFEWPERIPVIARPLTLKKTTNAFVQVLNSDDREEDARIRVRVVNAADSDGEQFYLAWSGHPATNPTDAASAAETAVFVPAGQSRVVRLPRPAESLEADRIVLRGDEHEFDNTFFDVPPRKQKVVVLFAGTDTGDDPRGLLYYLRAALSHDPLREVEVRPLDQQKLLPLPQTDKPGLIVIAQPLSTEVVAALRNHATGGGTLLFLLGDTAVAKSLQPLFEELTVPSADASPEAPSQPPADKAASGTDLSGEQYLLLGDINFSHPLFAAFAGPRYSDFTKIHFWRHQRLTVPPQSATGIVARFDNGDPALLEQPVGAGQAFVLATTWRPEDSQLALSSKFVPWMESLLDLATGGTGPAVRVTVGETVALSADLGNSALLIHGPGQRTFKLPPGTRQFSQTDVPGIYQVQAGGNEQRFAVNLAAEESDTAPLELAQLEQRGVRFGSGLSRIERVERERQQRDTELESRQKAWRWLIVAGLLLLIAETAYAGRADRILATAKEAAL